MTYEQYIKSLNGVMPAPVNRMPNTWDARTWEASVNSPFFAVSSAYPRSIAPPAIPTSASSTTYASSISAPPAAQNPPAISFTKQVVNASPQAPQMITPYGKNAYGEDDLLGKLKLI